MTPTELREAAEHMNRLPFVLWDRFTESDEHFAVFGWIPRTDGRSDWVRLEWWRPVHDDEHDVGYATSSAAYSAEIGKLLYGEESEHHPCKRVADHFGDLVRLKAVLA